MIHRDVARDDFPEPVKIPALLYPEIIVQLTSGETPEVREQAGKAIFGLWNRQGLLGVPIYAGGHWTLLCLTRAGGPEFKAFSPDFVEYRYYDSLKNFHEGCWEIAKQVMYFLLPTATPEKIRRNHTYQEDAFSCGVFLLHYWQSEVRQFLGQGWTVVKPSKDVIKKFRERLHSATTDIENFIKAPPKEIIKKKTSKMDLLSAKEFPEEGPRVPLPVNVAAYLAKEASRSLRALLRMSEMSEFSQRVHQLVLRPCEAQSAFR